MKKLALLCVAACASFAAAQNVKFNEVMINPPGTDNGNEYIELRSDVPNMSLNGLTIVVIEGDVIPAGTIDQAISLDGSSTGSNGLLLCRDSVNVLSPAPAAETALRIGDFVPDIENGANTFLIVEGFTGAVGQDLDAENDGVLDSTPWTRVVDAFGHREGNAPDFGFQYATQLGGIDTGDQRGLLDGYTPDMFVRLCGCAYGMDVLGVAPGPYFADPAENSPVGSGCTFPFNDWTTNPGSLLLDATCGPTCAWAADGCFADVTNDGGIDGDDVISFFAEWDAAGPCADVDASGGVDGDDVISFFGSWDAGGAGGTGC